MKKLSIIEIYEKYGTADCLGGYTTIKYLKRCEGYSAAKERGDIPAADSVIKKCASADKLQLIKAKYPDAFLLPVLKENNALPLCLCINIGLPICLSALCVNTHKRKNMPAIQRILKKPVFCGEIIPGKNYILVDDVITQGGTISSLMQFVSQRGGKISAILSLAYARGSKKIIPTRENLAKLKQRFGKKLTDFFEEYGLGDDAAEQLTNSEILYLMKFSNVENIRKKTYNIIRQKD
ncbi:MAG: phosphoribosyltransferase [Oscillospiraceae bacterium]|jgi:hypoxanthine-guanine phosphoribosyltransferase|nr:phosphoribosyltransferase [Oscillospiraceae bacterium]